MGVDAHPDRGVDIATNRVADRTPRQDPRTYVSPRETNPFARFEIKRSHLTTRIPGGAMNPGTYVPTRPDISSEVAHAASLTVCARATGVDDARSLLTALGLLT